MLDFLFHSSCLLVFTGTYCEVKKFFNIIFLQHYSSHVSYAIFFYFFLFFVYFFHGQVGVGHSLAYVAHTLNDFLGMSGFEAIQHAVISRQATNFLYL